MKTSEIFPKIIIFLLLLWQGGLCEGNGQPRMNINELVVNVTSSNGNDYSEYSDGDEFFSLRCEGKQKLYWGWTVKNFESSKVDSDYLDAADSDYYGHIQIQENENPNTDYPYVSVLTVDGPLRTDTAWYYCHYEGVEDWKTDTQNADKGYVFVHDLENAFVNSGDLPGSSKVTTADRLVIPCKTTLPDIKVTLSKEGVEIINKGVYDAKVGFILHNLVVQDSGTYTCNAKGFTDYTQWIVRINPAVSKLPQPSIMYGEGQQFVVGHPFSLNCSLIESEGIDVTFHWTLPNQNRKCSMDRSEECSIYNNKMISGSVYQRNTLTISSASLSDSGTYTCKVTARGKNPNNISLNVEVLETLHPFIEITSASYENIDINEGEILKWKSTVISHPPDPQLIYYNRTWNGMKWIDIEIDNVPGKVITEHYAMDAASWLKVFDLTPYDFGIYILKGITKDGRAQNETSVNVKVISKPHPSLISLPKFIAPNTPVNVTCAALGYPLPDTRWYFKSCPTNVQTCASVFEEIEVSDETISTAEPGNRKNTQVTIQPQKSGTLQCQVTNTKGTNNATQDLPISDIDGLVVLRHTVEGVTRDVQNNNDNIDVVMNDQIKILCAAVKFSYQSSLLEFSGSGPTIMEDESEWSWQNVIGEETVTKKHEGKYTCTVTPYNSSHPSLSRTLNINVKNEEEVIFLPDANMSPTGETKTVKNSFSLNCSVTGAPPPTITWFKDNEELTPDSEFFDEENCFLSNDKQNLEVKYVIPEEHEGLYKCKAENRLNTVEAYVNINVEKPGMKPGVKIGLAVAVVGIVLLVVVVGWLLRSVKTERQFRKSFRRNQLYLFEKGDLGQLNPDCTADEQAELLPYGQEWEVPREDIKLGKQLGSGAFGRVVKAVVSGLEDDEPNTTVAIKMCKSTSDPSQVRSLALELKIMIHLGKHLNIVNLMGASTVHIGKGELWILVEYCRFGNVLSFLHKHRHRFVNQINPSTGQLDLSIIANLPTSPLSPGSRTSNPGFKPAPVTDKDGYLAPSSNQFLLADPPKGRTGNNYVVNSDGSESEGGERQIVNNPMYNTTRDIEKKQGEEPKTEGNISSPNHYISSNEPQSPHVPVSPAPTAPLLSKTSTQTDEGISGTSTEQQSSHLPVSPTVSAPLITHSPVAPPRPFSTTSEASSGYLMTKSIVNTDNTVVHSPTPSRQTSPPPFSPMTHLDSSGVEAIDSQGNPVPSNYTYEVGSVPGVTAPFTTSDLICWAWQIAQGMDYLSSRKVLHGDLAARNLLLADQNVIKISDFGLSRDMYKKDIYMKKADDLMPVKWISIEAIRDRIFSVQSDVWAYGVTLWELFSLGSVPYPGIEVNKDFLSLLENGYRMDRPKFANQDVYDLLLKCWSTEPMERPSFRQVAEYLGTLMLPDLRGEYMTMNDPYMRMNEERFQTQTDYLNMMSAPDFHNLTRADEEVIDADGHTYINIQPSGDGELDTTDHYLKMNSPTTDKNPHYLPMSPTSQSSPQNIPSTTPAGQQSTTASPKSGIFSPRPANPDRFTFVPDSENTKLPELKEEEGEVEGSSTSLASDGAKHDDGCVDLDKNGGVSYINLPHKPDPNYINM